MIIGKEKKLYMWFSKKEAVEVEKTLVHVNKYRDGKEAEEERNREREREKRLNLHQIFDLRSLMLCRANIRSNTFELRPYP